MSEAQVMSVVEDRIAVASNWTLVWWRFRKHHLALFSAAVLVCLYVVVLCPDFFSTQSPELTDARQAFIPVQTLHFFDEGGLNPWVPAIVGKRNPVTLRMEWMADPQRKVRVSFFTRGASYRVLGLFPTNIHLLGAADPGQRIFLLGSDRLGRDQWSRIMHGTQTSMTVGLVAVTLSVIFGVVLGGISGYFGGIADQVIQRLIELLQSVPTIPIWLALSAALPRDWTPIQVFFAITVILSLIGWTTLGREVRGRFLALREEDFVLAANLAGCSRMRIILRHMVPTFLSHIIATSSLAIPVMIINETSLSFLGLGIRPPAISWGVLLQEAQNIQTLALAPWLLIPGLVVIVVVLAFNLVGDGLGMPPIHTATNADNNMDEPLLRVRDLRVSFKLDEGMVRAVDGVSFDVFPGQVIGIVGESGCGKSVTMKAILQLVEPPGRITNGEILYRHGVADAAIDLVRLPPRGQMMRALRGADIALIPQEPMAAFSPVHTVGEQIVEAIMLHGRQRYGRAMNRHDARAITVDLFRDVGISMPEQRIDAYSWQLSGGLRQRAMIAMALSCKPRLLIADEPTTAIDVTTQAQILALLRELQRKYDTAIIFITHDLGVIAQMANYVVVMYLGRVMEEGPVDDIFHAPRHPYTKALLRSIPSMQGETRTALPIIKGTLPHPFNRPSGCPFHPRCDDIMPERCTTAVPVLHSVGQRRAVSCFLHSELAEPA